MPPKRSSRRRGKSGVTSTEDHRISSTSSSGSSEEESSSSRKKPKYVTQQDLEKVLKKLQNQQQRQLKQQKRGRQHDEDSSSEADCPDGSDTDTSGEISFQGNIDFKSKVNSHIKPAIKEKIWKFQYVRLHTLLPYTYTAQDDDRGYEDIQMRRSETGNFKLKSKDSKEYSLSFGAWNDGFDILKSTIIEKYPEKTQSLIKYQMDIRYAFTRFRGNLWREYDERYRRKHNTVDDDWAEKDMDEWLNVFSAPKDRSYSNNNGRGRGRGYINNNDKNRQPGRRTCHSYNKNIPCVSQPCMYIHACEMCRGNHPVFRCTSVSNQSQNQGQRSFKPKQDYGEARPSTSGIIPSTTGAHSNKM